METLETGSFRSSYMNTTRSSSANVHHVLYAISIELSEPYKDNKPQQLLKQH